MPIIELVTEIKSTIDICFDLSRSIDLHKISTAKTNEQAISGTTSGLISLNEQVTWQATHFGLKQKLTTKITAFEQPHYFVDEQVTGAFKSMYHMHKFEQLDYKVIMKDYFAFVSPFGILGQLFNKLILTKYMQRLLIERNIVIKEYAESGKWKSVLNKR
ncbi:MAG: SRPBCC family protein [Bacteroidia bacterium]